MRRSLIGLVLLGCTTQTPATPPDEAPDPAVEAPAQVAQDPEPPAEALSLPPTTQRLPSLRASMVAHAEQAETAKAAVVTGNLPAFTRAVEQASRIALPGEHPAEAQRYLDALDRASKAQTLDEAGTGIGEIAQACAACHRQTPAGRFPPSGFVEGDTDINERMQLHWWAVEAMWQGITSPSHRAWEVGVKALTDPELEQVPGFPDTDQARTHARAFAQAARGASGIPEAERGAALGQILVRCAACHKVADGPELNEPGPDDGP